MKKIFLSLMIFSLFALGLQAQTEISGVKLPSVKKAGDAQVVLNGGGIREKWFLDVYVCGLYVQAKTSDAAKIIATDEPMIIDIYIVSGLVSSDKMSKATLEGFEKSTGGNMAALKTQIDKFIAVFKREDIVKNDIFNLVYIPGKGVEVTKNGKLQDTIAGLEFKKALFGIWLGKEPADDDLKEGMLGSN